MTKADWFVPRPRAGKGSSIGNERYALLQAAFAHVQRAIRDGHHLEAITVLESILTDRLGSMVHGSLGQKVTLRDTLGHLIKAATSNQVNPRNDPVGSTSAKKRSALPEDVISFIGGDLLEWWGSRNRAVHAMAKIHHVGDARFAERYDNLGKVAVRGVRLLIDLDAFDQREKEQNGAGHSATWPDALKPDPDIAVMVGLGLTR
jgi:hypothetical protein